MMRKKSYSKAAPQVSARPQAARSYRTSILHRCTARRTPSARSSDTLSPGTDTLMPRRSRRMPPKTTDLHYPTPESSQQTRNTPQHQNCRQSRGTAPIREAPIPRSAADIPHPKPSTQREARPQKALGRQGHMYYNQ